MEQEGGQIPSDIVRSWALPWSGWTNPYGTSYWRRPPLGSQFSVAVLQTVTGFEDRALFTHLRSAVEAGVIAPDGAAPDRYTFRHSLTAEALISSLAPAERASLARRAAGAIEHSGQPLDEDGRQLVATLQLAAGNRAAAAKQFAEAGRRMLASGAHGSAVVLLERAHPLAAERDRAAVAESLAVARAEGGDLDGALALADALPPVPARSEDASRRGRTHVELAWAAVMAERPADAARQAAVARDLLGPSPLPGPQAALAVVDGHLALLPGHGRADRDPVGGRAGRPTGRRDRRGRGAAARRLSGMAVAGAAAARGGVRRRRRGAGADAVDLHRTRPARLAGGGAGPAGRERLHADRGRLPAAVRPRGGHRSGGAAADPYGRRAARDERRAVRAVGGGAGDRRPFGGVQRPGR